MMIHHNGMHNVMSLLLLPVAILKLKYDFIANLTIIKFYFIMLFFSLTI